MKKKLAAPTSRGYSYFGTDHVKGADHASEGVNPETGLSPRAGTPGASNCHVTAGNPSGQAPGRNSSSVVRAAAAVAGPGFDDRVLPCCQSRWSTVAAVIWS